MSNDDAYQIDAIMLEDLQLLQTLTMYASIVATKVFSDSMQEAADYKARVEVLRVFDKRTHEHLLFHHVFGRYVDSCVSKGARCVLNMEVPVDFYEFMLFAVGIDGVQPDTGPGVVRAMGDPGNADGYEVRLFRLKAILDGARRVTPAKNETLPAEEPVEVTMKGPEEPA